MMKIESFSELSRENHECIFRWINNAAEVHLISGTTNESFTIETFRSWITSAEHTLALHVDDRPIAFGTLSVCEAPLSTGTIEICHLIVHPDFRKKYYGTLLVISLLAISFSMGFKRVVARTVPSNSIPIHLFEQLNWKQFNYDEEKLNSEFIWFEKRHR